MNLHAQTSTRPGPERIHPALEIADPASAWWIGQAILRLRREIAWRRTLQDGFANPAQAALDLVRHDQAKRAFFATDAACLYLSTEIAAEAPREGLFAALSRRAGLAPGEQFVLGLALAAELDAGLAPVLAACQGDAARPYPTLALAQALWEDPVAVLAAADPCRPLLALGLLEPVGHGAPLIPAPGLARYLAELCGIEAFGLTRLVAGARPGEEDTPPTVLAARAAADPEALEIVPLKGPAGRDAASFLAGLISQGGRAILRCPSADEARLRQALILAWLVEADLLVDDPMSSRDQAGEIAAVAGRMPGLGLRLYLHVTDRDCLQPLINGRAGPVIPLPAPSKPQRQSMFHHGLGACAASMGPDIATIAQDFHLEETEIARLTMGLAASDTPIDGALLRQACEMEAALDFQNLADRIHPRHKRADLVLPPAIADQFSEAMSAIQGAARVRADWGEKSAFGIGLLFAGPPGTGKTMAAEVIAKTTGLPLYRVDLSQIINKYIGETEKNLARVFDTAEKMRLILFFDEAEALFGKRTEVKDANDRFANVETGYLLQRMERFSGVAILATNRRKDLDDAFARRLRYVIDFPVPGVAERREIWARVFPDAVDLSDLDLGFLARQLQMTGGHIRSIALNAVLQAAARGEEPKVTMKDVLVAARRELDKLSRQAGRDVFGRYWDEIEELRA
ncbi:MAG: ATP-binding protein [Pseudomonadota bacterium]